jgi:hypothetical protein
MPDGWIAAEDGVPYPPEPWRLGGAMLVSVFRLPRPQLPAELLDTAPAGFRPFVLAGSAILAAAFAEYAPNGVLAYSELLLALAGRGANVCTIPRIWVDSDSSRAGARELWGIPKEIGAFAFRQERGAGRLGARRHESRPAPGGTLAGVASGARVCASMELAGAPVASLRAHVGRPLLPGLRRLPLRTVQRRDGGTVTCSNVLLARPARLHAEWRFEGAGPLAFLAAREPSLSVALTDMSVVFGAAVTRIPPAAAVRAPA